MNSPFRLQKCDSHFSFEIVVHNFNSPTELKISGLRKKARYLYSIGLLLRISSIYTKLIVLINQVYKILLKLSQCFTFSSLWLTRLHSGEMLTHGEWAYINFVLSRILILTLWAQYFALTGIVMIQADRQTDKTEHPIHARRGHLVWIMISLG